MYDCGLLWCAYADDSFDSMFMKGYCLFLCLSAE